MVENGEFVEADVFITPPGGDLTDEDSGDEDGGGMLHKLSNRQLQAEAEVYVKTRQGESFRTESSFEDPEELEDNNNEYTIDNSFIQGTVEAEAESTITEASALQKVITVILMQVVTVILTMPLRVRIDDSVRSVNQSISSKTRRAKHASTLSAEHGIHSTTRRGSSLGSNLSERSHKNSVAHTSVSAKANSSVRSSRDSQRGPNQSVNRTVRQDASQKVEGKWSKNDLPADETNFLRPRQRVNAETKNARSVTFFEDLFDTPILDHICQLSMLYAAFKGNDRFKVQPNEIRVFIAVLICSGYVDLPRRRMFREQASDVRNELVCSLMSRDRFEEIMKYIHVNDNTQFDPEDKYSKVRPLMDHLSMKFVDTSCGEEELDVGESVLPYYGRHGCKQFIRNKPIRFGYKIWCLNAPLGYLVKFIPHQWKGSVTDKELGLSGSVVVDLRHIWIKAKNCKNF